jgi:segregation and condensation protein B
VNLTNQPDRFSENEEAKVNISLATVIVSAELLGEQLVPMGPCESADRPDEVPVVIGYADDEGEEDEEDVDDLDEDEDEEEDDEEEDDEDLDYDWEEVGDEDAEEDNEDEDEEE